MKKVLFTLAFAIVTIASCGQTQTNSNKNVKRNGNSGTVVYGNQQSWNSVRYNAN